MEEYYIGIDNGLNGAIAVIKGKDIVFKTPMPTVKTGDSKNEYDCQTIVEILKKYPDSIVIIEKAHAMPLQGVTSMFNFGKSFGMMIGILTTLQFRYHIVHSKTWQKAVFRDQPHEDTKRASAVVAKRLFPKESFLPTERSKKIHDGLTDAVLMAYYGQNYLHGSSPGKM